MSETHAGGIAAVPFLHLDADGRPSLLGSRCDQCGAVMPGQRTNCAACGACDRMEPFQLHEKGKLHNYTIVYRSFPGVETPFIAVVVDLECGGSIKGVLLNVNPDPSAILYDMPLDVVYRDTGQRDEKGRKFISHYFVPSKEVAQ